MDDRWIVLAPGGGVILNRSTGQPFTYEELQVFCREFAQDAGDSIEGYRFQPLKDQVYRLREMSDDSFRLAMHADDNEWLNYGATGD